MQSYQTPDDELERFTAWIKENGLYVLYALLFGLAIAFGVRYWHRHVENTRLAAASLYGDVLGWYGQGKVDAVRVAVKKLERQYAATPYAALGALLLGKISYQAGDLKAAAKSLQWATYRAVQPGVKAIAKLRLARVLMDEHKFHSALKLVSPTAPAGFRSQYEELRGDVLAHEQHDARAEIEYKAAIRHLPKGSQYRPVLEMKLANLEPSHS